MFKNNEKKQKENQKTKANRKLKTITTNMNKNVFFEMENIFGMNLHYSE